MYIHLKKGYEFFIIEETNVKNFTNGGQITVKVECDEIGCDEEILKRQSLSFLNQISMNERMAIRDLHGEQKTISARVMKGESARVKYLEFEAEIIPCDI